MFTIFLYRFALFTTLYRGLLLVGLRLSGRMHLPGSVQFLTVLLLFTGIFLRINTRKGRPGKGGVITFYMVDLWTSAIGLSILALDFTAAPTVLELFACGSLLDAALSLAAIVVIVKSAPPPRRRTPALRGTAAPKAVAEAADGQTTASK